MGKKKTVESIPADTVVKMTAIFHRAFNAGGCDPACHCCYKKIPIGTKFKLATVRIVKQNPDKVRGTAIAQYYAKEVMKVLENPGKSHEAVIDKTKEVMLCDICTVEDFQNKQASKRKEDVKAYNKWRNSGGGCFRINGKIVH